MSLCTLYHICQIIVICISPFLFLFFALLSHHRFIGFIETYIFGIPAFVQSLTYEHISPHSFQYEQPCHSMTLLICWYVFCCFFIQHHTIIIIFVSSLVVPFHQYTWSSILLFNIVGTFLLPSDASLFWQLSQLSFNHIITIIISFLHSWLCLPCCYQSHHYNFTNTKYQEVCKSHWQCSFLSHKSPSQRTSIIASSPCSILWFHIAFALPK